MGFLYCRIDGIRTLRSELAPVELVGCRLSSHPFPKASSEYDHELTRYPAFRELSANLAPLAKSGL